MTRLSPLSLFWLLIMSLGLGSCLEDSCDATRTYVRWDPVYLSTASLRADIQLTAPRSLQHTGKIYYYQDYLLINEYEAGIHIFDNSSPAHPVALAFLPIPGNVDMAIRNDFLYADSYVDLLTFDLSNPASPQLVHRMEEVFPGFGYTEGAGYIIRYEETNITEEVACDQYQGATFYRDDLIFVSVESSFDGTLRNVSTPSGNVGTGGSLARFTIAKDHLFTVSEYDLKVFGLAAAERPEFLTTLSLGWGIETIFPYGNTLFIGAQNGMHTVDISRAEQPVYQGSFWHSTACDPVYVNGAVAYVTLRDGTECDGFANQLDVVNVDNLQEPYLLASFPMHHPIGLSVYQDHLYLCEDDEGLKVFDASEPTDVGNRLLKHIKGITAIDIITLWEEQLALVIGPEGLYQYDISAPANPEFLSFITVEKP